MPTFKKVGDLQINQDMDFQQKEWSFERWGWIVMTVLAVLALLGLFGQGLLSNTTAENETIQVKYGRFERLLAPAQYEIEIDPQQASNGELKLQVNRKLLSFYKIEKITPEPESEEITPEQIIYAFQFQQGNEPLKVTFDLQGNLTGIPQGEIGIENGPSVEISQFIYP